MSVPHSGLDMSITGGASGGAESPRNALGPGWSCAERTKSGGTVPDFDSASTLS
jgi:hypothetical protein